MIQVDSFADKTILCLQGFLVILALFALYFIITPWCVRQKYKTYRNVGMVEKYHPLLCDAALMIKAQKQGKYLFWYLIEEMQRTPDIDMFLSQTGPLTFFCLCSTKAIAEFEKLLPCSIDRHDHEGIYAKKFIDNSFVLQQSDKCWEERRKVIMKAIGINFASQYIEAMINVVDEWSQEVSKGEEIDVVFEMNKITFRIISKIFFGRDIVNIKNCTYTSPLDHRTNELSFESCYLKYAKDGFEAQYSLKGNLFPFAAKHGIIEPFLTINKNKRVLDETLMDFLNCSTDSDSVYKQVCAASKFSKKEIFSDMVALLYAAYDTTSHGVCSSLYFLHKNLQTLNQLNYSLKASGIVDLDPKTGSDLKDLYENCDYLNNCIKESLRIDPPLAGSILYITKSEVEICGIPLKKGTLINLHSTMIHHNPNIYPNPTEFIPERFDPESTHYFKNIGNGKDPRAYCPFSFGMRSCAGQSLAKLEMKVVLSRVLSKMRIEFNEETLKNNCLRFSIVSQAPLKAKFYSKF